MDILQIPEFLTADELKSLTELDVKPPTGHIDVNIKSLRQKRLFKFILNDAKQVVETHFETLLYTDYMAYTLLKDGDLVPPHIDNKTLDGKPNASPYRSHTAMIYLNSAGSDFVGGTLMFPDSDDYVIPVAGMLVGFSCNLKHLVTTVVGGPRKALAIWFSEDPKRERY